MPRPLSNHDLWDWITLAERAPAAELWEISAGDMLALLHELDQRRRQQVPVVLHSVAVSPQPEPKLRRIDPSVGRRLLARLVAKLTVPRHYEDNKVMWFEARIEDVRAAKRYVADVETEIEV